MNHLNMFQEKSAVLHQPVFGSTKLIVQAQTLGMLRMKLYLLDLLLTSLMIFVVPIISSHEKILISEVKGKNAGLFHFL